MREEPAHDHGIGGIVHHHLVEGENAHVARDRGGNGRNGIAAFLAAFLAQQRVDFQHEGVKMDPALFLDVERLMEQVHQHRLAAPDTAPHVETAG